jgi:hypothetical protein
MLHEEAEAERDRLQRADRANSYVLRERPDGAWEIVRIGVPRPAEGLKAERGNPTDPPPDQRPSLIRQIPPYGPPGLL